MRLRREVSPYGEVRELFWTENAHRFAILRRGGYHPPIASLLLLSQGRGGAMPFATNGIAPPAFSCKNIIVYMIRCYDEIFDSYIRKLVFNQLQLFFCALPKGFHLIG